MLWNQLEKNMGHEVETGFMHRLLGIVTSYSYHYHGSRELLRLEHGFLDPGLGLLFKGFGACIYALRLHVGTFYRV